MNETIGTCVVGEVLERGEWIRGMQEAPAAGVRLAMAFKECEKLSNVRLWPLNFEMVTAPDDRLPTPPEEGLSMMVCWAEAKSPIVRAGFSTDLDRIDLLRLREVTRLASVEANPDAPALSDEQCDAVIDEIAPKTAERIIREAVDSKTVH